MLLHILHHASCFDGAVSAMLFSELYRQRLAPAGAGQLEIVYRGLTHGQGEVFPGDAFDGDENAIVDFRYRRTPRLTYFFDHHQSTFCSPADEADFRADQTGRKFLDLEAPSCAGLIARLAANPFGADLDRFDDLVGWADLIDAARFPDPRMPVELREPALRVMAWVEGNRSPELSARLIADLAGRSLEEIAAADYVGADVERIRGRQERARALIERRARCAAGVVGFDLSLEGEDGPLETYNRFLPYYLFPECSYVVAVTASRTRAKISVGWNPWSKATRGHNVASLCERHGGGGHAAVGAISFPPEEIARARIIARAIAAELAGPASDAESSGQVR